MEIFCSNKHYRAEQALENGPSIVKIDPGEPLFTQGTFTHLWIERIKLELMDVSDSYDTH